MPSILFKSIQESWPESLLILAIRAAHIGLKRCRRLLLYRPRWKALGAPSFGRWFVFSYFSSCEFVDIGSLSLWMMYVVWICTHLFSSLDCFQAISSHLELLEGWDPSHWFGVPSCSASHFLKEQKQLQGTNSMRTTMRTTSSPGIFLLNTVSF